MITYEQFMHEMALKNFRYQTKSDIDDNIGQVFNDKDTKLISHPKTARECERVLAKSGYDFNILMIARSGGVTSQGYKRMAVEYCKENNIPIEGHITFFKNSSSGDLLKPWMILHTLGHALVEEVPSLRKGVTALLLEIYEQHMTAHGYTRDQLLDFGYAGILDLLARIFQFNSARLRVQFNASKQQVDSESELIHELVAEFLWHGGRIRWQIPQGEVPQTDPRYKYAGGDLKANDVGQYGRSEIKAWQGKEANFGGIINKIEEQINVALHSCVGKIIYDLT